MLWSPHYLLLLSTWLLPRPKPPPGALHHERLPSVWMPDLVGLLLATTFLAMPFIISAGEPWLGGPWMLTLFMWPPGLIALAIFWIAARYQCFWIRLEPHALTVNTTRGTTAMEYDSIARISPDMTLPPRWLGPLLVLFGGWRGLGVALLHANRPSRWIVVERKDGSALRLPADAFPDARKVIAALERAGVPISPDFVRKQSKPNKKMRKPDGRKVVPTTQ